jgi:hypothetical protein
VKVKELIRQSQERSKTDARQKAAMGPCTLSFCSCQRFVFANDAQFCDNCGHSRSKHR